MSYFKPCKSIPNLIHSRSKLEPIIRKAHALRDLENLVRKVLANYLQGTLSTDVTDLIHVVNFAKGQLVLLCDNAAVSTRIRYLKPELIKELRKPHILPQLATIELKTRQQIVQKTEETIPSPKSRISSKNSHLLKATLKHLKSQSE